MTTFSQTQEPTMDKSLAQEIRRNIKSWQKCRAEWIALAHSHDPNFDGETLDQVQQLDADIAESRAALKAAGLR
jgi:hypothetical protein